MSVLRSTAGLAERLAEQSGAIPDQTNDQYQDEPWISPGDYRQQVTGGRGISRYKYDRFVERAKDMAAQLNLWSIPDDKNHPTYPVSVVRRAWEDVMSGYRDLVADALRKLNKSFSYPNRKSAWDHLIDAKNDLWRVLTINTSTAVEIKKAAVEVSARLQKLVEDCEKKEEACK